MSSETTKPDVDLSAHFAGEGVRFRFGWDDHAAGGPAPFDPEQRRGWMEREQMKRKEQSQTTQTSEFYTVVYEVQQGHHDAWWSMIQPMFLTDDKPITVKCVTRGDLAERVDQLETAAEDAESHG